jgi:hypothetical protein
VERAACSAGWPEPDRSRWASGPAGLAGGDIAGVLDRVPTGRDMRPTGSTVTSLPDATMNTLTAIPGVSGVAEIHSGPTPDPTAGPTVGPPPRFVSCAQLAAIPAFGRCPAGADIVAIDLDYGGAIVDTSTPMSEITWPVADMSRARLRSLPVDTIAVGTDASAAAVEQARTVLELAYPATFPPLTFSESTEYRSRLLNQYRQLANVVILTSLPIAGCSLAVSVAGGLAERKRPFSLLRLTGTPLAVLRRVVLMESALPLLVTSVVSAGAGLLTAYLFLRAQLDETLQPLRPEYYLLVFAGLVASLAVIASTMPLLGRITGPETARNE